MILLNIGSTYTFLPGLKPYLDFAVVYGWWLSSSEECRALTVRIDTRRNIVPSVFNFCAVDILVF
jgi:hypothetical protein